MASFTRKIGNKLVDTSIDGFAKFVRDKLLVPIISFIGALAWSLITGHPEIAIAMPAIGLLFLLGVWLGFRYAVIRKPSKEKLLKQKILRSGELVVLTAYYGNSDVWEDVTDTLNEKIQSGARSIIVTNENMVGGYENDPLPNVPKRLIGAFAYKYSIGTMDTPEYTEMKFPPR